MQADTLSLQRNRLTLGKVNARLQNEPLDCKFFTSPFVNARAEKEKGKK